MSKHPLKLVFVATFVFLMLFAQLIFAQNVQSDLRESFRKFDIVKQNQVNFTNNQTIEKLSIQTAEKNFYFDLTLNDLRSSRYFAEQTGTNGTQALEKAAVKTYKGKISGEENSRVRLTIDGAKIEGFFDTNGERFYVEQAKKYSRFADENDLVVYRAEDLMRGSNFDCESGIGAKIERGKEMISADAVSSPQTLRVIEIATDADFQYVAALGGANQANAEIAGILNMAEGVYESELRLTIRIVYSHFWTTPDPFSGVNAPTLLSSFQGFWNTNHVNIPRDTVHLFTGKSFALSSGYALISEICDTNNAYGLSGYVDWSPAKFLITAHELGHNLGAFHASAAQSCDNTLMNEQLTFNTPLSFCSFSRTEINNFVNSSGSCLTNLAKSPFDFDGDSRTDISIFRPAQGEWWYLKSSTGGNSATQFGNSNDKLVPADFTGDGKTDIALFRPADGSWFVLRSEDNSFYSFPFGNSSDVPVVADFDGDGKADAGVFRPMNQTWFVSKSTGGTL
ncbi:MAG TPA: M12 family metallo-peptidase, partial [Pyrinomonadaceae bacterium]|nr:M12 family metallo-peptidase [Pyrinomonadaceae bacterium]